MVAPAPPPAPPPAPKERIIIKEVPVIREVVKKPERAGPNLTPLLCQARECIFLLKRQVADRDREIAELRGRLQGQGDDNGGLTCAVAAFAGAALGAQLQLQGRDSVDESSQPWEGDEWTWAERGVSPPRPDESPRHLTSPPRRPVILPPAPPPPPQQPQQLVLMAAPPATYAPPSAAALAGTDVEVPGDCWSQPGWGQPGSDSVQSVANAIREQLRLAQSRQQRSRGT